MNNLSGKNQTCVKLLNYLSFFVQLLHLLIRKRGRWPCLSFQFHAIDVVSYLFLAFAIVKITYEGAQKRQIMAFNTLVSKRTIYIIH